MIIDLDVHQGNGTASIFSTNREVFTISFHGKKNYPFRKEKSDIDVEFDDNTDDHDSINADFYRLKKVNNYRGRHCWLLLLFWPLNPRSRISDIKIGQL